jgi:hypothetical protein
MLANESFLDTCQCEAARSDLLRYEILYRYGGIYVDVDFECRRNIEPVLTGDFVMSYENYRHLQPGFMACTAQHPFIKRLIEEVPLRWQKGIYASAVLGPQLIDVLRRDPALNATITKLPYGIIGPGSPESYAVHHSLASWQPNPQVLPKQKSELEGEWGSHLPLVAGLWRRVPGEVIVEAGIGHYSTPFWVKTSLRYFGIDTNPRYVAWAEIEFRDDKHVTIIPMLLPDDLAQHRHELSIPWVNAIDNAMQRCAELCPNKIDILMADSYGPARLSAIKAFADRATTVILHDTECWDGYQYEEIVRVKPWRHHLSLRPKNPKQPWTDAFTMCPVDWNDLRQAVCDVAAVQFWLPSQEWDFVNLSESAT